VQPFAKGERAVKLEELVGFAKVVVAANLDGPIRRVLHLEHHRRSVGIQHNHTVAALELPGGHGLPGAENV